MFFDISPTQFAKITPTELQVIKMMAKGMLYKEIAAYRGVAEQTVKNQIENLFIKLGLHNQRELIGLMLKQHIIELTDL